MGRTRLWLVGPQMRRVRPCSGYLVGEGAVVDGLLAGGVETTTLGAGAADAGVFAAGLDSSGWLLAGASFWDASFWLVSSSESSFSDLSALADWAMSTSCSLWDSCCSPRVFPATTPVTKIPPPSLILLALLLSQTCAVATTIELIARGAMARESGAPSREGTGSTFARRFARANWLPLRS